MATATDKVGEFDYVILGGGVVGLSTAFHLLRRDSGSVLVLDAGPVGSGASGLGAGMFVTQRFEPLDVKLAVRSREILRDLGEMTNGLVRVNPTGRLALVGSEDAESYLGYIDMQNDAGTKAIALEPAEVAKRYPFLNVDDVALAGFSDVDGTVHPPLFVAALTSLIRARGGFVWEGLLASRIEVNDGGGGAVLLQSGERIRGKKIVVAAGAWTSELLTPSGFPIPQQSVRTESAVAIVADPRTEPLLPALVDGILGAIHVPRSNGIYNASTTVGESIMRTPETLANWRAGSARGRTVGDESLSTVATALEYRFPDVGPIRVERGWAGIIDATPDERPLLGVYPGTQDLFVGCGFGGYGVTRGLAAGEALSGLVSGESSVGIDIGTLGLDRFDLTADLELSETVHNPLSGFRDWGREID